MSDGLLMVPFFLDERQGNVVSGAGTAFFAPGRAGASLALQRYLEFEDQTFASAEISSITHRNADGSDTSISVAPGGQVGRVDAVGIAFDDAMSSVTVFVEGQSTVVQWVLQVIFF